MVNRKSYRIVFGGSRTDTRAILRALGVSQNEIKYYHDCLVTDGEIVVCCHCSLSEGLKVHKNIERLPAYIGHSPDMIDEGYCTIHFKFSAARAKASGLKISHEVFGCGERWVES